MGSPRLRIQVVVMVAAVAGFVAWLVLRGGSVEKSAAEKPGERLTALPPAEKATPGNRSPVPEFGADGFKDHILDRCAKWVESRNRDAGSLVAMWDLSGDQNLLNEAASKFPNDPRVCVAMIQRMFSQIGSSPDADAASKWVERFIAAEPGNPAGWYWKARLSSKNPEAALEALRVATGIKGGPDLHLRERITTVREASLVSGLGVKGAAVAALNAPLARNGQLTPLAGGDIGRLLDNEIAAAEKAGSPERVAEIASLGAAAAEHLRLNTAPTATEDLVRIIRLYPMLKKLDPGMEFGDGGKTVGMRLNELTTEKDEVRGMLQIWKEAGGNNLLNLTETQSAEFADRFILHGEVAAGRWLKSQPIAPLAIDETGSQGK